MLGLYSPILILQAFCLYHAYRNNAEQRWYWLIIFVPGIGSIIYLVSNFSTRNTLQSLSEGVKEVVNTNHRIEQLEKAHRFSDSASNKLNLADAYVQYGRYKDAMTLYSQCLEGFMKDDPAVKMKFLEASFLAQDYEAAVACGKELENTAPFKKAEARIAYAWSLHRSNQSNLADKVFQDMNKPFTNYKHRLSYCNFLKETGQSEPLRMLVAEMLEEFEHMKSNERRMYRDLIRQVTEIARSIDKDS